MNTLPLLYVEELTVGYTLPARRLLRRRRHLRAVDGVSLTVDEGETLGLVGETGCGKSSLSRAVYGLTPITSGRVLFSGIDVTGPSRGDLRVQRRGMQMIFQDPGGSLNPRMRVGQIVAEPLEIHRLGTRQSRRDRVASVLTSVGLAADDARRHVHELSGGQRQRVAIARTVVAEPALIIADEPVSALDVSLQAQILNLIAALRSELGLALLFVSHDLAVVGYLCDRIAVMYLGRIVETGEAAAVLAAPAHPYTRDLVASSPVADPDRPLRWAAAGDEPANPVNPPDGCRYHPGCPHATAQCRLELPELRVPATGAGDLQVACHHAEQIC